MGREDRWRRVGTRVQRRRGPQRRSFRGVARRDVNHRLWTGCSEEREQAEMRRGDAVEARVQRRAGRDAELQRRRCEPRRGASEACRGRLYVVIPRPRVCRYARRRLPSSKGGYVRTAVGGYVRSGKRVASTPRLQCGSSAVDQFRENRPSTRLIPRRVLEGLTYTADNKLVLPAGFERKSFWAPKVWNGKPVVQPDGYKKKLADETRQQWIQ